MELGLSITSGYSGVTPQEAAASVVARAEAAAEAGFSHLTLGDQHSVGSNNVYLQGSPMLGRLLGLWPSERQAGLLFLLPLWHPVLVAEQIGTLAAMSSARFIVQTGIGSGEAQFGAMGAKLGTRGATTDVAIDVIDRLLRGEVVSSNRFGIDNASIGPTPSEPVEWWIGSGPAEAAIERAASVGDAIYIGPSGDLDHVSALSVRYRQRCAELGRPSRVALRRDVFVGDDDAEALAVRDRLVAKGYRGMSSEVLVCGGVGRVEESLAEIAALGVDDLVVRMLPVPTAAAVRSIELLGELRKNPD